MLELKDLTRAFRRRNQLFNAVEKVNLKVNPGELVVISGRSGNGKTTLLNLIMGLLEPSFGTVTWNGQQIDTLSDSELSRMRNSSIGYVTQRETLLSSLCVWDNVLLPSTFYSAKAPAEDDSGRESIDRALSLLTRLEVAHLAYSFPKELSGGEIRRVAIARALINNPSLFLADEPTGDLDQESTELVLSLLRETAKQGSAVIMVTHDPDSLRFADRTFEMHAGQLLLPNSESS